MFSSDKNADKTWERQERVTDVRSQLKKSSGLDDLQDPNCPRQVQCDPCPTVCDPCAQPTRQYRQVSRSEKVCPPTRTSQQVCQPQTSTRKQICREIDAGSYTEEFTEGQAVESERLILEPITREKTSSRHFERTTHVTEAVGTDEIECK
ncbi:hypothetical protein RCL1_003695 [Eukaryota sp. TZLM3-RCL]